MSLPFAELWARLPNYQRAWLTGLDKFINWKLGGSKDETMSERLAHSRNRGEWAGREGCRILDKHDPGHCDRAAMYPTKDK